MQFTDLPGIVGDAPLFETGLLLAGDVNPADVRRRLSRWTANGRLYQLRRGRYTLAPPYHKVKPHPFAVENALVRGSYVSLQAALAHYGLIPDIAQRTTSVTTGRPGQWSTPLGIDTFRHNKRAWFHGYQRLALGGGQTAFVATPEKALLDLVYLQPGGDDPAYLAELRLQATEHPDLAALARLAEASGSPRLRRAGALFPPAFHGGTPYLSDPH
jgi:predicted transcriptional regulator of viral defense system